MTDKFIRHFVSTAGFLIALFIFVAGYVSGTHGWWWAIITSGVVYLIVYKLVDAGH